MKTTWQYLTSLLLIVFSTLTLHASTYYLQSLGGADGPPYPFDPSYGTSPLSEAGPDQYLVEDGDSESLEGRGMMQMDSIDPNDAGSGGTNSSSPPPNIRNYAKYSQQTFSLLDTNSLAAGDTNLYNVCAAMVVDTNTIPILQIQPYGPNAVIVKASHFDYSAETIRDFALIVCDNIATPTWKTIDFAGVSDAQDGWLVQGTVPRWKVTDGMFMLVSNINLIYPAFFRAIPYSGAQIVINGDPQPNDVVSNIISLNAQILDLSGTTNEQFDVMVDNDVARYGFGATNSTVSLDTKYNPAGLHNVFLNVSSKASVYDVTNAPDNTKLYFTGSTSVPLDFENDTYLMFASDFAPPEIGTNYFYYSINKEQDVAGIIFDPSDGHVVLAFTNHVPYATEVYFGWNFTEADGVTPYTNDTYAVRFIAFDPADLINTNTIDRHGVRPGAGCYLTYEEENPFPPDGDPTGIYLNQQADTWINQTLKSLYNDMYRTFSLTEYTGGEVGGNRNHSDCQPLDEGHVGWADFMQPALSNSIYSDLTIAQAHGNGATVGGGPYLLNKFTPTDLQNWLMAYGQDWRLRKAAIWTCYSATIPRSEDPKNPVKDPLSIPSFINCSGIRLTQQNSYMRKNCGLFFTDLLPQLRFGGNSSVTTAQVAAQIDEAWVCGANAYPGGCDPTYSWHWAVQLYVNRYAELDNAGPFVVGFRQMPYSSLYDDEIMMLDTTHVKDPAN